MVSDGSEALLGSLSADSERFVASRTPWQGRRGSAQPGNRKSVTLTCFAARVMQEPAMENPTPTA